MGLEPACHIDLTDNQLPRNEFRHSRDSPLTIIVCGLTVSPETTLELSWESDNNGFDAARLIFPAHTVSFLRYNSKFPDGSVINGDDDEREKRDSISRRKS